VGDDASGVLMEDQAHLLQAFLDAFEGTQAEVHLERARILADVLRTHFRDDDGAFRDRVGADTDAAEPMQERHRPITDAPSPAGNAVAALCLLRLAALAHDAGYAEDGHRVLRAFAGSAARMPTATATFVRAVSWATQPVTTVVVVAVPGDAAGEALFKAALETYHPRTVVRRFAPGGVRADELPPELHAMVGSAAPRAYVCTGQTCAAPIDNAPALAEHLRTSAQH
jgi:uncharacterized protein YyaL (SSP411 family)